MLVYEDMCVGCPPEIGCIGTSCPHKNVPTYYCDKCGEQDKLYYFEDRELCIHCIEEELEPVEGSYF